MTAQTRARTRMGPVMALALLAAIGAAAWAAEGQSPAGAEAVLHRAADYYAALESYEGRFTLTQSVVTDEGTSSASVSIAFSLERPNKLRARLEAGSGPLLLVSDGRTYHAYSESTGKYFSGPAPATLLGLFGDPLLGRISPGEVRRATFGPFGDNPYAALTQGVETMELAEADASGDRVVLETGGTRTDLWVSPEGAIVKAAFKPWKVLEAARARHPELKDVAIELSYAPLRGDEGWGPDPYAFVPPDGARRVEKLSYALTNDRTGLAMRDFTLEGLEEGTTWRLAEHKGKVIALNFWATWCPPCRAELPKLAEIYNDLKAEGFLLLAVNKKEGREEVRKFLEQLKLDVPVALDREGTAAQAYGAEGIPRLVLIDREGIVRVVHVGYAPGMEKLVRAQVEALLAGQPVPEH